MINSQFFDSVLINDISVISGVRYNGRTVDNSYSGRKHHGFLYIHSGEATFYADGTEFVVLAGSLLYIPKNKKYRMVYTAESTTFVVVNFMLQDLNGKNTVLFENMELVLKDQKTNSLAQVMTKFELCSASKNRLLIIPHFPLCKTTLAQVPIYSTCTYDIFYHRMRFL